MKTKEEVEDICRRMDKVDEIHNSSLKLIDETEAFIRKHNLYLGRDQE